VERGRHYLAGAMSLAILLMAAGFTHAAYKETNVANGGTIKGKLTYKGALPSDAVENVVINKNPEVCGEGYREVVWIDVKGGALRGAFVYIEGIPEGKAWPAPKEGKYLINQKGCRFQPWAQVVKPGSITIRNSDKGVLHNINTREMIGVEKGSAVKKVLFNCEAHNFMFGFMMAPEHPYAEVVGDDGSYAIRDVPPGAYTVKAWHPRLGLQESKVTVPAKGTAEASFEFKK